MRAGKEAGYDTNLDKCFVFFPARIEIDEIEKLIEQP